MHTSLPQSHVERNSTLDNSTAQNTPAKTLAILADAGAGFTKVAHRQKRPFEKGWPTTPHTLAAALAHLDTGGNVGMLGGYSDLYTLDFDCDADDLPDATLQAPETLRKWRDNAPERVSFAVRCPEGLPNVKHTRMEIKGKGAQAVWAGVHESGAIIRTAGSHVPTVARADIAALWSYRTGSDLVDPAAHAPAPAPERTPSSTPVDIDDAELLDRMFASKNGHDIARLWHGDAGDDHSSADYRLCCALAFWTDGDAGRIDRLFRQSGLYRSDKWERSDYRNRTITKAIDNTPDGYRPRTKPPDAARRQTVAATIEATKTAIKALNFADLVPVTLQAINGYRTGDVDRTVANAALTVMAEQGKLICRISGLELSTRTGFSPVTCRKAMQRLSWLFATVPDENATAKTAPQVALRTLTCLPDCENTTCQSTQLPLDTHTGRDAFVRSLGALTPAEFGLRNAAHLLGLDDKEKAEFLRNVGRMSDDEIAQTMTAVAVAHQVTRLQPDAREELDQSRYQRRLDAIEDAPGPGVLLMLDAIGLYGACDRETLATVMHKSKYSISRLVQRGLRAGLLVEDGAEIDIAPDWKTRVDELDATCPNAGTMQRRRLAALDSRLEYTAKSLENAHLSADDRNAMHRRHARAQVEKWRMIADGVQEHNARRTVAGIAPIDKAFAVAPGATLSDSLRWQRQQTADKRQAQASLRSLAHDLVGLDYIDAQHMALTAGYSQTEFSQAWSLRQVTA